MLEQKKNTIYEIYKSIFNSPIKNRQKAIIFSKVYYHMALEINWRVIKVSKDALIHCKRVNNFGFEFRQARCNCKQSSNF